METAQKYINCPRTRSIFYAAPSFLAYEHYVYQNDKIVFFNVALSYLAYERYIYQHSHGPEEFRYNGSTLAVFKAANPMLVIANGNTLVNLRIILPDFQKSCALVLIEFFLITLIARNIVRIRLVIKSFLQKTILSHFCLSKILVRDDRAEDVGEVLHW